MEFPADPTCAGAAASELLLPVDPTPLAGVLPNKGIRLVSTYICRLNSNPLSRRKGFRHFLLEVESTDTAVGFGLARRERRSGITADYETSVKGVRRPQCQSHAVV